MKKVLELIYIIDILDISMYPSNYLDKSFSITTRRSRYITFIFKQI